MRALLHIVVAALALAGLRVAHADNGALIVDGDADLRDRTNVATATEIALRQAGWSLPSKDLSKQERDGLLNCTGEPSPTTCVPPSFADKQIRAALAVTVTTKRADDGAVMIALRGRWILTDPPTMANRQRFCEQCDDDKLTAVATELARQLFQDLAAKTGRTYLKVTSVPAGAQISIDGAPAGVTDAEVPTFPGEHAVIIAKPGYRSETVQATALDGKTSDVAVTLQTAATAVPSTRDSGLRRWAPRILVIGGVVSLGVGSYLIATDEDADPVGKQSEFYRDSAKYGLGFVVLGGALLIGGAYWWLHDSKTRSTPTVSFQSGGGSLGWTGTF